MWWPFLSRFVSSVGCVGHFVMICKFFGLFSSFWSLCVSYLDCLGRFCYGLYVRWLVWVVCV